MDVAPCSRIRGFDGSMPEPEVWAALRATMCFVALDVNDHVRGDPNAGHYFATSENAELYTQPIDEEKAYITHQEGGLLKRVLSSGWKIGEEMVSLPDDVVALLAPVLRLSAWPALSSTPCATRRSRSIGASASRWSGIASRSRCSVRRVLCIVLAHLRHTRPSRGACPRHNPVESTPCATLDPIPART